MAAIKFKHKGNFEKTTRFFKRAKEFQVMNILKKYGEEGVKVLSAATPERSGKTAESWGYEIKKTQDGYSIFWTNSNVNQGVPIAILIQFGHGTGTGGYVPPTDFINPAMKPIFDELAESAWREVTKL